MKSSKEKVIYMVAADSLEQFEEKVKKLAKLDATHVFISQIEKSRWLWERDLKDPYPNWSMILTSLFKIIRPKKLEKWLPKEYSERNYEYIVQKSKILEKYNLKGAFQMKEPFYLPEEVFREHPNWRGPRCDHPRRATNYYYSPCVDNQEVLDMYKDAMEKLCTDTNVEYFYILTNDSGGGLCWSTGLYTGANGPTSCKDRPMSARIKGFLDTLQEGARLAGKEIELEINSNIGYKENEHTMDAIWPQLSDNQSVNKKNNKGEISTGELYLTYDYTLCPVNNILMPFTFMKKLEDINSKNFKNLKMTITPSDFNEYYKLLEKYILEPTNGLLNRTKLITEVANEIVGIENAKYLVEAWNLTEEGVLHFNDTGLEGLVSCCVNQRWINRPFVLFPDELKEEEKDYYRKYQFQANDEAHANDLLDIQNSSFVRGYSGVFIASKALAKANKNFNEAISNINNIISNISDKNLIKKLLLYIDRIELLICFMNNVDNAINFQHIIDTTDYENEPLISPEWPLDAEPNLLKFEEITRKEIDNTNRIIELIKGRESKMLEIAATHELEDIFLFSPKITEQLILKTHIMMDHLLDDKRLYVTHNK